MAAAGVGEQFVKQKTMLVAFQLVGEQLIPLKARVLAPCVDPRPVPVVVTLVPTGPDDTERLDRFGVTVNRTPFDCVEPTFTMTLPVEPPLGTVTPMVVAPQLVIVKLMPSRVAVELPWVDPKLVPVIVNVAPILPLVADRLVMVGVEGTGAASIAPSMLSYSALTFSAILTAKAEETFVAYAAAVPSAGVSGVPG